jgi:hypothetical protein
MPAASSPWVSTFDKTSHLTQGWSPKIIYNFQYPGGVSVVDNDNVFNAISNFGDNYKGSNVFPANYFTETVDNDGKCLRITMYFYRALDGTDISMATQLYDLNNEDYYGVDLDRSVSTSTDGGNTLVKYECYLTQYYADRDGPYVQMVGSIMYSPFGNGSNMSMGSFRASRSMTYGVTGPTDFRIVNTAGTDMQVVSVMIEEIG